MPDTNDPKQDVILHQGGLSDKPEADQIQSGQQREVPPSAGIVAASYQFIGPIPSPQDLAHYESVIPGLADRLISRFEKQSDHRMSMEREVTRADAKRANCGLAAGFSVAVVTLVSSTICILHGHDWSGTILGGGTLASLVGTFVYGSNSRKQERIERQKILVEPDEKHDKE